MHGGHVGVLWQPTEFIIIGGAAAGAYVISNPKKVIIGTAAGMVRTELKTKQAIQDIPELKKFAEHLLVEQTPEGLRIQILDQAKRSMFPLGSSRMYSFTKKIIENVAHVVASLPNRIALTGHTDAKQYTQRSSYTNWELSTDRANASRRVLLEAEISVNRIFSVVGKADTELLMKDEPFSPANRRFSITLLKKAITAPVENEGDPNAGPLPHTLAEELAYYEEQERKAAELEKNPPPAPDPEELNKPPDPKEIEEQKYEEAVEIPARSGFVKMKKTKEQYQGCPIKKRQL